MAAMNRAEFQAIHHGYRALRRSDAQWKPDPYADRRGMFDTAPDEAGTFLRSLSAKVRECLSPSPAPVSAAHAKTQARRDALANAAKNKAVMDNAIRQMRAIDASKSEWLRMAELMRPQAPVPCATCRPSEPCWYHRNAWRSAA